MSTPSRLLRVSLWLSAVLAIVALSLWSFGEGTSPPAPPTTRDPAPSASSPTTALDRGTRSAAGESATTTTDAQRTPAAPRVPQLTGRLVQAGKPLPNVVLRLYTIGYVPTATDQTVTTDADGRFATAGNATGFSLRTDAPSVPYDWATSVQAPLQSDRDLGDVVPPLSLALDLLVVDATGRPIAEPHCWLSRSEIQVDLDPRDARAPRLVRGDANGRAHLDRLHPGPLHLKVSGAGFAMVKKIVELDDASTAAPLHVTLIPGRLLHGRVFDWSGKPLPGAVVSAEGRQAVTDATGAFGLPSYGDAEPVHVEAKGHRPWWPPSFEPDYSHIQLERLVGLRGLVRGGNAATSIVLAAAPDQPDGVPWPGPYEKLGCLLPVAADGTFAVEGLVPSDYIVHARSEGLGASLGQRVALRGDAEVELVIDPEAAIALRVVDAEGRAVDPIEVVCSLAIVEYPSLFGPYGTDIPARVFEGAGRLAIPAVANRARVPAPRDEPLALGVRSPGFLPAVRTFAAGEAPVELTIELARSGAVRGVVSGGRGAAYLLQVSLWAAEQDALGRANKAAARQLGVDAQGRFSCDGLPPGSYRAAVYHYGRARIGHRPDEQIGAVPLVDEDEDLRTVVAFDVIAGTTTDIELAERPFGTLRGRVLEAGRTVAGAWVVAARPGVKLFAGIAGGEEIIDWDDVNDLEFVAGQRSGADGSFVFLFRAAGPVELRVRHATGGATMPPVVVDLPSPGDDVHRDLEIAVGGIRGRFVGAGTDTPTGRARVAVLFPLAKAADDPFYTTDWTPSLAWSCKRCDLDADGNFAFAHLPDGEWLVRVTNGINVLHAQRVVTVRGGETDVGELREPASVAAKVAWHWPQGTPPRQVYGVWLYEERGGAPAIWVGTHRASADGADVAGVAPGKYLAVVFGELGEGPAYPYFGTWGVISGSPLSKPSPLEIRGDGTTVPAKVELAPAAAAGR